MTINLHVHVHILGEGWDHVLAMTRCVVERVVNGKPNGNSNG